MPSDVQYICVCSRHTIVVCLDHMRVCRAIVYVIIPKNKSIFRGRERYRDLSEEHHKNTQVAPQSWQGSCSRVNVHASKHS